MAAGVPLPAYAPDLNPAEGIWSLLKRSMINFAAADPDGLVRIIKRKLKKIQYRPHLINGCLAATGLLAIDLLPVLPQRVEKLEEAFFKVVPQVDVVPFFQQGWDVAILDEDRNDNNPVTAQLAHQPSVELAFHPFGGHRPGAEDDEEYIAGGQCLLNSIDYRISSLEFPLVVPAAVAEGFQSHGQSAGNSGVRVGMADENAELAVTCR